MKTQALFLKDKSKKNKMLSAAILFGASRVKAFKDKQDPAKPLACVWLLVTLKIESDVSNIKFVNKQT